MTLGILAATPRILSRGGDDPPSTTTPFRIAKPSSREALSHRLAGDATKSLRKRADMLSGVKSRATPRAVAAGTPKFSGSGGGSSMGPPSWTPRKTVGSLTPAARNLLDRSTFGGAGSRRAEAMDRASGWTSKSSGADARREQDLARVRWTPTPGRP